MSNVASGAPARATPHVLTIRVDEFGSFELPQDLFRRVESLIPARFRQSVSDIVDVRGQEGMWRLAETTPSGTVRLSVRNLSEISQQLRRAGTHITWTAPALEFSADATAGGVRSADLQRIIESGVLATLRFGQLEVSDIPENIADLSKAFPYARMVIPVSTNQQARELQKNLGEKVNEHVGLVSGLSDDAANRITVATQNWARQLDKVAGAVVLLPFKGDFIPNWMRRLHKVGAPARLYLVRQPRSLRGDVERELLLRYGPRILQEPRVSPEVSWVNFGGRSRQIALREEAGLKRGLYWQNEERHRFIAAVATSLTSGFNAQSHMWPGKGLVVVENRQHGERLCERLPGWQLIGRGDELRRTNKFVVVTLPALSELRMRPEWVVNAMGGPPSSVVTELLKRRASRLQVVRLIDLSDGFHAQARRFSEERRKAYLASGFVAAPLPDALLQPAREAIRN